MTDFDGRTVLVTGAGGGIGGATVQQLVAAGAQVIAAGRTADPLAELAAQTGARPLLFDVRSEDSVRDALDGLDVYGVVNCAGSGGEIAAPMVFLLGDGASMISGVTLPVDGGYTCR